MEASVTPIGKGRYQQAARELLHESLLDAAEVQAFRQRLDRLIDRGTYPRPVSRRSVPWPPI